MPGSPALAAESRGVFRTGDRLNVPLLLLFVAIHAILLVDAVAHEPGIGYDAANHLRYIEAFSGLELPTMSETTEFFSPPLPYLAPSLLRRYGLSLRSSAKGAQLFNVLCSMLLAFSLLRICDEARPGDARLKFWSLALLGLLPVYYRSFSLVRGEPMLAALCVFVAWRTLRLVRQGGSAREGAVALGLGIGAMILSRQWGFFILPAIVVFAAVWIRHMASGRAALARAVTAALVIGALSGGWFYLILKIRYGSITAFNRDDRSGTSLANQPAEFYFGLGDGKLFTDPVRPSFPNQLVPMFYSEVWGDYWCYFDVYAIDTKAGLLLSGIALARAVGDEGARAALHTNFDSMRAYLGRVNAVSLLPSALLLAGVLAGGASFVRFARGGGAGGSPAMALVFLCVAFSLGGYFWFLLNYLSIDKGEAIKGTYILQVFPFVCLLGGELFTRLIERRPRAAMALAWALAACAAHNLPVLFTRMTILY